MSKQLIMTQRIRQYGIYIMAALLIIVFIVLSIDGRQAFLDRGNAQNAANAAAKAAALAKVEGKDYLSAAQVIAAVYGYNNDGITNTVQVHNPPTIGPYSGARDLVQVVLTFHVRTHILNIRPEYIVYAVARGVAGIYKYPSCSTCSSSSVLPSSELLNGGGPIVPSAPNSPTGVGTEFANIDELLKQSIGASLAYNKPETMNLGETVTIELLLNPSVSQEQLSTGITEAGTVKTATVEVTPRMTAYLYTHDSSALSIQPLQESPEQLISDTSTTKWSWSVKALEGGTHKLTLKLFRVVKYDGVDYPREVDAYESDLQVKVSFGQQIESLDWKWALPTIATALLVPAFWRWYDTRKKRENEQTEEKPKEKQKQSATQKKSQTKKKS